MGFRKWIKMGIQQSLVKKDPHLTIKMKSSEGLAATERPDGSLKQGVILSAALWLRIPLQSWVGEKNFLPSPSKKPSPTADPMWGRFFQVGIKFRTICSANTRSPELFPEEPPPSCSTRLVPCLSPPSFAQADGPWPGQVQLSPRALAGSGHPTTLGKWHKSLFVFFTGGN